MMPPSQSEGTTNQQTTEITPLSSDGTISATTGMEPKKRPLMPADLVKAVILGNRDVLEQRLGLAEEDPDHVKIPIDQVSDPAPPQATAIKEILASELQSATRFGNTILHLLVANKQHNDLAVKVFEKDRKLLTAQNKKLETPLHIAAKFGNAEVIESLNRCAPDLVKNVLKKTNDFSQEKRKTNDNEDTTFNEDTALHLAVKNYQKEVVHQLTRIDREMIYEFNKEGLSPLHIAIANTKDYSDSIVRFRNKDYTKIYHFGTAVNYQIDDVLDLIKIMLDVDPAAAWTQFADGTFPIHVAARMGKAEIVAHFISNNWEQALLSDPDGRNLFHIAAANDKWDVIYVAISELRDLLKPDESDKHIGEIINSKDYEGNTPLHIAAVNNHRALLMFLVSLHGPHERHRNNKGRTAFQMSTVDRLEKFTQRQKVKMYDYWKRNGEKFTEEWFDLGNELTPQEVAERTQVIGLGSVLITTIAFAAAFTFPGGYNGDNGTPILGRRYMFRAFMVANALAFVQSFASIFLLIKNYFWSRDNLDPEELIESAALLFLSAATSMVKAFGIGSYVMLAPVNLPIAIIILILGMLFGSSTVISLFGPLPKRLPVWLSGEYKILYKYCSDNYICDILSAIAVPLAMLAVRHGWPYLLIFGVAFLK